MLSIRALSVFVLSVLPCLSANFGTVINHTDALSDILLDESRTPKRLYVLDPLASQVEVYSLASRTPAPSSFINLDTGCQPLAMAMSAQSLYVACYATQTLDVIDLTKLVKTNSVSLPAPPEAVAVGSDGKVLVSTIGTATGQNILTIYDPSPTAATAIRSVLNPPGAPVVVTVPLGTPYLASHARLVATPNGSTIVGVHESATGRTVFVYDVPSATVLRSRTLAGVSPILAVAPDGSRFVSGQALFDTASLAVLAQQNATNSPFTFVATANFTTQANQGGAIFSPDGTMLYTAYNIVPNLSPTPQANAGHFLINTPDNLLIKQGIQLSQNLSGKMVITADGGTIYALSQSGFLLLPVSNLGTAAAPIATPDSTTALLVSDQCGVNAALNSAVIPVRSQTGSALTVTAQILTTTGTSATLRSTAKSYGGDVTASFSAVAARTLGTAASDQLLIQAAQAVNLVPNVRVFQNNRNSEAAGTLIPVDIGAGSLGLTDMLADSARQRLYLANPGLNRIEVFDMQQQKFLTPYNVGQLPRSLAFGNDAGTLYVANSGGESISLIDLNSGKVSAVQFPALPSATSLAIVTPQLIASSLNGPQVVMNDGTLWKIVGNTVVPRRPLNPAIFGTTTSVTGAQSMVSTQDGQFVLLLAATTTTGTAYLYSATADDFVRSATVLTAPLTGYIGPVAAGPAGQYYVVGGNLLDSSLTLLAGGSGSTVIGPVGPGPGLPIPTLTTRPVSAVAAVGPQSYLSFSTPIRTGATTAVTDAGTVALITADLTTGTLRTTATANALESPASQVIGAARVLSPGRTMAVDAQAASAYVLTASGLSIVPLTQSTASTPQTSNAGVVNLANFQTRIAPTGLVGIFGKNLATTATSAAPLPSILGGTCVTLNNVPIPLMAASPAQINAQIPTNLVAGNYPLVVRSIAGQQASTAITVPVSKYAPAIFVDSQGAAIFHKNGARVTQSNPAVRDEELTIYATGLGPTTGGRVTTGQNSPSSPLAVTGPVAVYFGDPTRNDTGVIVDWSGLVPGEIGMYQINGRVPGRHFSGNNLPATLVVGGVSSPTTGPNVPLVSVN
jgi:uncharacterized protein (TIGR03437 family)